MNLDSDNQKYERYQRQSIIDWERVCLNCGACCGAFEKDPCQHLNKGKENYYCDIYENRFGEQRTITGKKFTCVPIRDILHKDWSGKKACGYIKKLYDYSK